MSQSIKKITKITMISAIPLLAIAFVTLETTLQASAVTTSVNSSISSIISVFTSSGTVTVNATPSAGGVQTIANDVITVSTNDVAGYTLKLNETGASSTLVSGGNSIAASSGTLAAPVAQAVNTWGYRVDSIGGFGAGPTGPVSNTAISGAIKFAAVPVTASPDTIKTTATTATNDTTSVWYGVAVNTATPSGAYTNSVTYTAIAN
ncbi:MAG TPA: hypothetical protein VIM37_01315 [Candidatus Microsaccharimonas sp.]|jgi:hypothetical protein